jgi:serine/threonine protein kinase
VSRVCPVCQVSYGDEVVECPLDGTALSKIKKIAFSPSGDIREGSLSQEPMLDRTTLAPTPDPRITALAAPPSSGKIAAVSAQSGKFLAPAKESSMDSKPSQKATAIVQSSGKIPAVSSSAKMQALAIESKFPPVPTPEAMAEMAQKQLEGKEEEDETLPAGTRCAEYQIESKIGEGGMGIIYRAVHPLIGKQAAVKVLRRELCHSTNVVSRFLVEAMAVNKIRHPNTVDIFSFGQLPDGRHFLIMELLEGKTLEDYLKAKGGRLTLSESLVVFRPLVNVLSAAHNAGIIHRDLKPENVFLANNPEGPFRVKLLDFGIAKLMEGATELSHKTSTGRMMGTPYYMAPEQILGHKNIDARADQYSLGIILFQMLSGELPFSGKSLFDVASKHVQAKVPDLPPLHGRSFSPELFEVIEQALAKRPESRFANVKDFLIALETTEPNSLLESKVEEPNLKTTRAVEMPSRSVPATIERISKPISSESLPAVTKERKPGETIAGQAPRIKPVAGLSSPGESVDKAASSPSDPLLVSLADSGKIPSLQKSVPPTSSPEIPTLLRSQVETPAPQVFLNENNAVVTKSPTLEVAPEKPKSKKPPVWIFAAAALVTGILMVVLFALPKGDTTVEPKKDAPVKVEVKLPELKFLPPAPNSFFRGGVEVTVPKK